MKRIVTVFLILAFTLCLSFACAERTQTETDYIEYVIGKLQTDSVTSSYYKDIDVVKIGMGFDFTKYVWIATTADNKEILAETMRNKTSETYQAIKETLGVVTGDDIPDFLFLFYTSDDYPIFVSVNGKDVTGIIGLE